MAGGTAADIRAPWPQGEDGLYLYQAPCTIVASKTKDFVTHVWRVHFAFFAVKCFYTAQDIIESNAITLNIQDDTGTPVELLTDFNLAAITGGAGGAAGSQDLSISTTKRIEAGALLEFSYGSGATDSTVDGVFQLYVRPIN